MNTNQETSPIVTVFGGSSPKPKSSAYLEALDLGKRLARAGCTVQTGGYIGTMEAVSRGAAEAGGHVIGVTCDEIERWRPIGPNRWVKEERRRETLRERLYTLIDSCQAALALPGGVGTLAEISLLWSELQIQSLPNRPLILIGDGWKKTFQTLIREQDGYIPSESAGLLQFFSEGPDAVRKLVSFFQDQP